MEGERKGKRWGGGAMREGQEDPSPWPRQS